MLNDPHVKSLALIILAYKIQCSPVSYKLLMIMITIRHYLTLDERDLYMEFLKGIRDPIAKAKVASRVNRMASGNFGDHKPCRDGVWELRIDQGPGYRVYYSLVGTEIVLLLLGGDKRTQNTDIDQAIGYLNDYLKR